MAMSRSPRLIKGGLVLLDPASGAVLRVIALQYNPDTLTRSLDSQAAELGEGGRSEALRLDAPAIETIRLEAELDATDALETGDDTAAEVGLHPRIAALEGLLQPTSDQLRETERLAGAGVLEILPAESPLVLFVWSRNRIAPVRVTGLSVTEEAFDPALNPIRAKVSLALRVLSVDDLGFTHRGGSLYMAHHQRREQLASRSMSSALGALGIERVQ